MKTELQNYVQLFIDYVRAWFCNKANHPGVITVKL